MEYRHKVTKHLAAYYLNGRQHWKPPFHCQLFQHGWTLLPVTVLLCPRLRPEPGASACRVCLDRLKQPGKRRCLLLCLEARSGDCRASAWSQPSPHVSGDSPGPTADPSPGPQRHEDTPAARTRGGESHQPGADHQTGKKPWLQSKNPFISMMDLNSEVSPDLNLWGTRVTPAAHSSFVREDRTKLNRLRKRAPGHSAPGSYDATAAPSQAQPASPSCYIGFFLQGTPRQSDPEDIPGRGRYDAENSYIAFLPSSASINIEEIQRPKRHETSPLATLRLVRRQDFTPNRGTRSTSAAKKAQKTNTAQSQHCGYPSWSPEENPKSRLSSRKKN